MHWIERWCNAYPSVNLLYQRLIALKLAQNKKFHWNIFSVRNESRSVRMRRGREKWKECRKKWKKQKKWKKRITRKKQNLVFQQTHNPSLEKTRIQKKSQMKMRFKEKSPENRIKLNWWDAILSPFQVENCIERCSPLQADAKNACSI